jgi:hypothetical protein
MGEIRNSYTILIGKLEEKRPLGRLGQKLDDDNATGLWEIVSEVVAWIQLAQDGFCEYGRDLLLKVVPQVGRCSQIR